MKRNRKLTWIEKRRINKIAFDHPYFDIHGTTLTNKEVDNIIKNASGKKTGKEVVTEAYLKAGIPLPEYTKQESPSLSERLVEIFTARTLRRVIAISVASIMLVFFFAFTPIGRAAAETVYQIIVDIFDGSIFAHNETSEVRESSVDFTMLPSGIKTLDELAKQVNYPIIISSKDSQVSLFLDALSKDDLIIRTKYKTNDDYQFTITQELYGLDCLWGVNVELSNYQFVETSLGIPFYLLEDDSSVRAVCFTEQYRIDIVGNMPKDRMISILQQLSYVLPKQ